MASIEADRGHHLERARAFGRALAHDRRYADVGWDDVRPEASTHWEWEHGAHTWDKVEGAAREAFESERREQPV